MDVAFKVGRVGIRLKQLNGRHGIAELTLVLQ
jgi:hypothetical protein